MDTAINVGASVEAIKEARAAIIAVMTAVQEPTVAIAGLKALKGLCAVTHTSINNCTIIGEQQSAEPLFVAPKKRGRPHKAVAAKRIKRQAKAV